MTFVFFVALFRTKKVKNSELQNEYRVFSRSKRAFEDNVSFSMKKFRVHDINNEKSFSLTLDCTVRRHPPECLRRRMRPNTYFLDMLNKWNVPLLAPTLTSCHHHLLVTSHQEDLYDMILFFLPVVMIPLLNKAMTRTEVKCTSIFFWLEESGIWNRNSWNNSIQQAICAYQRTDGWS